MRPAVVILGFVLGSAAAITFALVGTTIVFMTLRSEYPRLDSELAPLLGSAGLFFLLTAAAGGSFYGEIKLRPWRRAAHAALLGMLGAVAVYHAWPRI
jgi:urea transporter